jgi:hypothetical protein
MQSVASPFRHVATAGKMTFAVMQLKRLLTEELIQRMQYTAVPKHEFRRPLLTSTYDHVWRLRLAMSGEDLVMKEFRLTFAAEDFAAVSQALVAMGVGFHVEPIASTPTGPEVTVRQPPSVAKARGPAKGARKAPAAHRTKQSKPDTPVPPTGTQIGAADRLREAIGKSGNAYRSVVEPATTVSESETGGTTPQPRALTSE